MEIIGYLMNFYYAKYKQKEPCTLAFLCLQAYKADDCLQYYAESY